MENIIANHIGHISEPVCAYNMESLPCKDIGFAGDFLCVFYITLRTFFIYILNKKDKQAIVCEDVDGNIIRLTREVFSGEDDFLRWKDQSDVEYHLAEKEHHLAAPASVRLSQSPPGATEYTVQIGDGWFGSSFECPDFKRVLTPAKLHYMRTGP